MIELKDKKLIELKDIDRFLELSKLYTDKSFFIGKNAEVKKII